MSLVMFFGGALVVILVGVVMLTLTVRHHIQKSLKKGQKQEGEIS